MASLSISAVSHIAICVRDLDRSLLFYRDLLGLRVEKDATENTESGGLPHLYRDAHRTRRVVHLRYGDGPSTPFLVLTEHPGDQVGGEAILLDQVGISHFSFTVPRVEEVLERLLANGAVTQGPPDAFREEGGRITTVFLRDPDGILIQLDEIA